MPALVPIVESLEVRTVGRSVRQGRLRVASTTGACNQALVSRRRAQPSALPLWLGQPLVGLGPAISVELPHIPHLTDLVEVELRGYELRLVARGLGDELTSRVTEVALPVKLADVPRRLVSDSVDRAHEIRVRHGVRRLLELPQ